MAPNVAAIDAAYQLAENRLVIACSYLERHLPPLDPQEVEEAPVTPSARPRERIDSVSQCNLCAAELADLDAGARDGHVCTHRQQGGDAAVGARGDAARGKLRRVRQPYAGVIRQGLEILDEKFDSFTGALTTLTCVIEETEVTAYNEHLMEWADYCGYLKDRAHDTINML